MVEVGIYCVYTSVFVLIAFCLFFFFFPFGFVVLVLLTGWAVS